MNLPTTLILILNVFIFPLAGISQLQYFNQEEGTRIDNMPQTWNIRRNTYLFKGDFQPTEEDILSGRLDSVFQKVQPTDLDFEWDQYYWGAFRLKNEGINEKYIIYFNSTISEITFFEVFDSTVIRGRIGDLVPNREEISVQFLRPGGGLFMTDLPKGSSKTYYYRFRDESRTIQDGSFAPRIFTIQYYANIIVEMAKFTFLFAGAVAIFWLLNLIFFLYLKEKPFLHYVLYLTTIGYYSLASGEFIHNPDILSGRANIYFNINYYLISITYLSFIRSFLNLKILLPFWDKAFKWLIWTALVFMIISSSYLLFFRFDTSMAYTLYGVYLIIALLAIVSFLVPLYKAPGINSKFIFWGSISIFLGVLPNMYGLIFGSFGLDAAFTVQMGLLCEMVIFSLGLAYSQSQKDKAKQEALNKNKLAEEKSKLYTNITHEFRTPLTLIQGSVGNIREYLDENKDKKTAEIAVQSIKKNGQNLLNLVNQLLDLAKLDAKQLELGLQTGDIIVYFKDTLQSFDAAAINRKISLNSIYEVDTLVMDFDPVRLQQIIFNLVGNALKFTPEGGTIVIKIDTDSVIAPPQLLISIEDTGAGISAKNIPYIFDRFYQADHEQAYTGQGTGIGLSLVKELVELMGGSIEVESQEGKGTRFKIKLPIENESIIPITSPERMLISEMSPSKKVIIQPAIEPISSSGEKDKLLLIEDHPELLEFIKDLLSEDYQIITAANGRLGIEQAIEQVPDLIVSDVMMPEKNGYEVCQTLKEDSRTSHIPIILLTAKADLKDKIAGWEHGADAYLSKPFQRSELFAIIRQLITQRKKLQALYRSSIPNPPKSTVKDKNTQKEHIFLTDLNRVLEENLENENMDVGLICEKLDMSRSQVHRKLKALTGFSTTQYIRKIRLYKAKALLESTDTEVSVADVAYMVGFKDRTHFSRTFSEEFGLPPSFFKE